MIYHANSESRTCVENPTGSLPEGWVLLDGEDARAAWVASLPVVAPAAVTYSDYDYANAIQLMLDREAKALRNYDDMKMLATYKGDPCPLFAADAEWGIGLRSFCWVRSYALQQNPPAEPPTPAELAEQLLAEYLATNPKP